MELMMTPTNPCCNDTNSSNNTTGILESESLEFKTIKIFFYFVILICSTFGNIMVAYIICVTRKMRTGSNYLILNLAICDTLTPLISIPFDFALEENGYVWGYGGFMCKILWPASTMTATSSALTLAVIALDRYRLIMHPFKPRLTFRVIKIAIVCTHVFAMMLVSPYVAMLKFKNGVCDEFWPSFAYRQGYTVVLCLVQYGLPLPFMVVMYVLALKNLYKSTRRASVMQNPFISQNGCTKDKTSLNGITKEEGRKEKKYNLSQIRENEANKRATLMFIVVVAVFTVFMFPNQLIWLWADFGDGLSRPGFRKVMIICWLFTYCNSVFNPVIFTAFSKDFRNGFKKIFTNNKCSGRRGKGTRSVDLDLSGYSRPHSHSVVSQVTAVSMEYTPVDSISHETVL